MIFEDQRNTITPPSLGQRRGISDLARIALDLTWAPKRTEHDSSSSSRAYPSPPMSGSPPLPPTSSGEIFGRSSTSAGSYSTTVSQDARLGGADHQAVGDSRGPREMQPVLPRLFQQELPVTASYVYRGSEHNQHRPTSYAPPDAHAMPQTLDYQPAGGSGAHLSYAAPSRTPATDNVMTSPKSQRKTKGHVASACVPCKRAHLRCDAQRPCSRCITNGKEDSCVDVQHKKRGRPRLREDRDTRYDPTRYPHPQDDSARRPLSIYPSAGSVGSEEHVSPRYMERISNSETPLYSAPLPISNRAPEPVAFLNTKLEFAKVSPTFIDAIGRGNIHGQNLADIVSSAEHEKILAIRSYLIQEQSTREPNYLPPILASLDQVIHGLGFSLEEVVRFQLDRQESLVFETIGKQPRHYLVSFGLAKEGSIYFVVLMLKAQARSPYPLPHPNPPREAAPPYGNHPPPTPYAPRPPAPSPFDPARSQFNESPTIPRPTRGLPPPIPRNSSSSISNSSGPYSASPSRIEYPSSGSYQVPRSEVPPAIQPRPQPSMQLPPIRPPPEQSRPELPGPPREQPWYREERTGRVDIGGLIEKPDSSGRPR